MSSYDFDIKHLEGKENNFADTLSRFYKNPEFLPPIISNPHSKTTEPTNTLTNQTSTENPKLSPQKTSITPTMPLSPSFIASAATTFQKTPKDLYHSWGEPIHNDPSHNNCEYNLCRGRSKLAGHHPRCPFLDDQEEESKTEEAPQVQESILIKEEPQEKPFNHPTGPKYTTTEICCMEDHPDYSKMHWTACYVDDCRIHTSAKTIYGLRGSHGLSGYRWISPRLHAFIHVHLDFFLLTLLSWISPGF